jgi:Tol biopolymer transport system component
MNDKWESAVWLMNADGSHARQLVQGSDVKWSPDGKRIAYVGKGEPNGSQIFIRWMDSEGASTQVSHVTEAPSALEWSPDGKSIAFTSTRGGSKDIWEINSDGSGLRELARVRQRTRYNSALVASPDGRWLAYSGGSSPYNKDLFVVSSSGGRPRRITHTTGPFEDDHGPAWSPDGKFLAFDRQVDDYNSIFVARVDGSRVKRLTPGYWWHPVWSPDGRIAYIGGDGLYLMNRDGSHKHLLAKANIFITGYEGEQPVAWSPDGRLIAYLTREALWVVRADGSHRRKLYSGLGFLPTRTSPVWSPDSRSIAFTYKDGHDPEIFVVGAAGGEAKNLTANNTQDDSPSWSPNSAAIAYVCGDARGSDICVINSDGSGRRKLTDSPHWAESSPAWLPSARSRR